jgi:hypothetical protein
MKTPPILSRIRKDKTRQTPTQLTVSVHAVVMGRPANGHGGHKRRLQGIRGHLWARLYVNRRHSDPRGPPTRVAFVAGNKNTAALFTAHKEKISCCSFTFQIVGTLSSSCLDFHCTHRQPKEFPQQLLCMASLAHILTLCGSPSQVCLTECFIL